MNIDQWIEGLEQAGPPNESPLPTDQSHVPRKRGRGSKTSSLLEPFANRKDRGTKGKQPVVSIGSSSPETSNATSTSTSRSPSQSSSSSSTKYQRRPRHHTKADKYHSKNKSKSKPKKKRKERKSKQSRRKKHRSEATTGVVQTFRAKNVPKSRITLDPGTKFGLYTNGRSSGPTRGKGLPDLVFSEMRFLQKPESPSKEEHDSKAKKKSQKKKSRHSSDKEISRYFDAGGTRPSDNDPIRRRSRHTPPPDTSTVARNVQPASPVVSDLLEKPFLGFGGRGTDPPVTSHYSWSESGRAASARVTQFAPILEPLAAGQLQSSRTLEQISGALPEQETTQDRSAEQTITKEYSKGQDPISESAQEASRATRLPVEPRVARKISNEAIPIPVLDKHKVPIPAPMNLTPQNETRFSSTNRTLSTDKAPNILVSGERGDLDQPEQRTLSSNHMLEQHPMPWEMLLQNCEQAARPSIPTFYDDGPLQYDPPDIQDHYPLNARDQYTPAAYDYADFRLWGLYVGEYPEHDYPDNAACISEHVHWAQPEAIEYQDGSGPFFEEWSDEDPESLDSHGGYDGPAEDGVQWDEGAAEEHDEVQDFRFQDGETMDEFAMFWQPNRLY